MQLPSISVIIPTHNRQALLLKTLMALSRQFNDTARCEVIVVADSCKDSTVEVVSDYAQTTPYRLQILNHTARSAAATRNLGASVATGKVLLFLDDDVQPQPGLIATHLAAQAPGRVTLGYSKPVIPTQPSWWQQNARRWWEDRFREMRQPGYRFTYRDMFSGNMALPAELFHSVAGFDTAITGRLEDYELGLRLLKAGAHFKFLPDAVGLHEEYTDLFVWLARVFHEGAADVYMGQRHPELRNTIFKDFADEATSDWKNVRQILRRMAFKDRGRRTWRGRGLAALARVSEKFLHSRGAWWHTMGAAREYNYWRGVASEVGNYQAMLDWLQEAPPIPTAAKNAPRIDVDHLPTDEQLQVILDQTCHTGLKLLYDGLEFMAIAPQPGYEPLRPEHIRYALYNLAQQTFVPALALHLVKTMETSNDCKNS